jgi:hypothetical protein
MADRVKRSYEYWLIVQFHIFYPLFDEIPMVIVFGLEQSSVL